MRYILLIFLKDLQLKKLKEYSEIEKQMGNFKWLVRYENWFEASTYYIGWAHHIKSQISNSEITNFSLKYYLICFIFSTAKLGKTLLMINLFYLSFAKDWEIMVKKFADSEF